MPHDCLQRVALTTALLVCSSAATAATAGAQFSRTDGVGASAVVVATSHALLSGALAGGALTFRTPVGARFMARFGVERVSGVAHHTGIACEKFIAVAAGCVPERIRDDGWLGTLSAGLGMRVLGSRRLAVDVALDARVGGVAAESRGLSSGRTLQDGRLMVGGDLELAGAWWPSARVPLAIEAGLGAGGLGPLVSNHAYDGYEPFTNGFALTRFRIGLAWRPLDR